MSNSLRIVSCNGAKRRPSDELVWLREWKKVDNVIGSSIQMSEEKLTVQMQAWLGQEDQERQQQGEESANARDLLIEGDYFILIDPNT